MLRMGLVERESSRDELPQLVLKLFVHRTLLSSSHVRGGSSSRVRYFIARSAPQRGGNGGRPTRRGPGPRPGGAGVRPHPPARRRSLLFGPSRDALTARRATP